MLERRLPNSEAKSQLFPLSAAQLGIWFAQSLDPLNTSYSIAESIEIEGEIDALLFESVLHDIVEDAEALRLRFIETDDGPKQYIGDIPQWSLHVADLANAVHPRAAAEQWMRNDLSLPT